MKPETEEKIYSLLTEETTTAPETKENENEKTTNETGGDITQNATASNPESTLTTETKQELTQETTQEHKPETPEIKSETPEVKPEVKPETPETKQEEQFTEWKKGHKENCQCAVCKARRAHAEKTGATGATGAPEKKEKRKPERKPETQTGDARADLFETVQGYKVVKPETTPETKPQIMDASKFINGALFLIVMDSAFPLLFTTVLGMFDSKYKRIKDASKDKLKLTEKEKSLLEAGADEVVKYLFAGANPIAVFTVSVGFIYYSKFESLNENDFHQPKPKPHE